jgi:hypothetical protein
MARKNKVAIEQMEGIEIANPLYDAVFKRLMENNRVASYFIESFIGEKIESINMIAKEQAIFKWSRKFEKFNLTPEELESLKKLTVMRLDFVATVKTDAGSYKKVLIEVQKARDTTDVMRFRNYLAEHYKRRDTVTLNGKTTHVPLPVITIYLLGFNLSETDVVVIRASRTCHDMIAGEDIKVKIPFVEQLTHDSYLIQLGRISGKMQTRIEKVLSVFEQRYFLDSRTKINKKYPHSTDDQTVCLMLEILEHINSDPEQRAEIELEWASHEVLNGLVTDRDKKIKEQGKALQKALAKIAESKQAIAESKQAIAERDQRIAEKDQRIAELERLLGIE